MEDSDQSRRENDIEAEDTEADIDEDVNENAGKSVCGLPTFDFTEKSWKTDFVLVVEGTKLYVGKTILSLASPVFDTMFQSSFKESSRDELELPGKKLNDVIEFLRCIFPNTFTEMTAESALKILHLIEEYQVLQHKPRCEAVLLESVNAETDTEDLFRLLQGACMYDLHKLRDKCVLLASEKPQDELDKTAEKCSPPPEAAKEIFEKINKKLRENIVNLENRMEEIRLEAKESKNRMEEIRVEAKERNEELRVTNADLVEELDIMKQYLSADIKKTKDIAFDGECCWEERQLVLTVNMKADCIKSGKDVLVWGGIPLRIVASEVVLSRETWLNINIKNTGGKIDCQLKVRVILVNRQPKGVNETFILEGQLDWWRQNLDKNLKQRYEVMNCGKGFVYNGRIGMIVQIFMSKPNRE